MAKIDRFLKSIDVQKVSDIHITSDLPPMIRVDGLLITASEDSIPHKVVEEYIKELISDKYDKFLKYGELDFKYYLPGFSNFRVNIFKSGGNFSITLRVIREHIPKLTDIAPHAILYDFIKYHDGLVLVTGPTGSGKSTTLAAMINEINNSMKKHIITLEDPIEYMYKSNKSMINQREVGEDTLNYETGLKAALREDPDIICVGEMRDRETIESTLRAAQTGHLVFSTLHNMGASESIYRIVNSFESGHQKEIQIQLASLLRGVVSQILFKNASGIGRTAAMEIMVCTSGIKNLIREGNYEQIDTFIQIGSKFGMQTMDMDIKRLASNGIISRNTYEKWIKNNKS
ncbi:PilT/PilU family type 4a pilus ATPase [Clostridium sp. BJN0001]|uniref:type IV pilus twitching motility protein PilT n=1 Tax=Clostridium sp. BJN0001 TaxID=2930219 RepID=UPI001FD0955A|nr:PilT/PilU family type 4a pilus ATPase [Clostridium sp. BJN0001]